MDKLFQLAYWGKFQDALSGAACVAAGELRSNSRAAVEIMPTDRPSMIWRQVLEASGSPMNIRSTTDRSIAVAGSNLSGCGYGCFHNHMKQMFQKPHLGDVNSQEAVC